MSLHAKLSFMDAMIKLLEKNPKIEINVVSISQESGLTRRTFYDNFIDIYDFKLWVHEYLTRDVIEAFWQSEPFENVLLSQLLVIQKYQSYYLQLVLENGVNAFRKTFVSVNMERTQKYLHLTKTDPLYFIAETYTLGAAEQIYRWIEKDFIISPEELSNKLMSAMPEKLYFAYKNSIS